MDQDLNLIQLEHQREEIRDINLVFRVQKRYIRDVQNPLEFYREEEFRKRYRFSKDTFNNVLMPLLNNVFDKPTQRGLPIPPTLCMAILLRFYATGSFQTVCGDLRGISQPTVSRVIKLGSGIIASHLQQYVKFPENKIWIHNRFYDIANFPRVTGCIDCTHISIRRPPGDRAEVYRNRKGSFSLNVQVVSGPDLKIYDIVARWPGREHDSMIFNNSSLKMRFERNELPGFLLGDSGYACLPYMMTPLHAPRNDAERRYNRSQIKTRNVVERLFGIWKRRFPCLQRQLGNKLNNVPAIIIACAVLHNIGIETNDPWNLEGNLDNENDQDIEINMPVQGAHVHGQAVRQNVITQHFT